MAKIEFGKYLYDFWGHCHGFRLVFACPAAFLSPPDAGSSPATAIPWL